MTFDREFSTADKSFVLGQLLKGDHSLYKGIRGYAAGMGNRYVFTSSGIYYGHKFKTVSIVLGYRLPVVCICYGHKMRMNGNWFGQNLSQPVME